MTGVEEPEQSAKPFPLTTRLVTVDELVLRWPANQILLKDVRARLLDWLGEGDRGEDVLLVVTELLTNARSASTPIDAPVTLYGARKGGVLSLAVTNQGRNFEADTAMPDGEQRRGRGLPIASALGQLKIVYHDDSVTVSVTFAVVTAA